MSSGVKRLQNFLHASVRGIRLKNLHPAYVVSNRFRTYGPLVQNGRSPKWPI